MTRVLRCSGAMLLATLGFILAVAITPAVGHVTDSLPHLVDHMKDVFYTKGQSTHRFVHNSDLESSGRITMSNPINETIRKKILIETGPFILRGVCARNNVGDVQAEIHVHSNQAASYIDSFGNGTDGAIARSQPFGGGSGGSPIAVLSVVQSGGYDAQTYTAITPNGKMLTGTVSAGVDIQEADCVFTATGHR